MCDKRWWWFSEGQKPVVSFKYRYLKQVDIGACDKRGERWYYFIDIVVIVVDSFAFGCTEW